MWKPGNLVTIKGIVYRVKRKPFWSACCRCTFNTNTKCEYPISMWFKAPGCCYLKRISPIMKMSP